VPNGKPGANGLSATRPDGNCLAQLSANAVSCVARMTGVGMER